MINSYPVLRPVMLVMVADVEVGTDPRTVTSIDNVEIILVPLIIIP